MTDWKRLDDAEWSSFREDILSVKGGAEQEKFLRALKDGDGFIAEIDRIPVVGDTAMELYPVRLSEAQFKSPPCSTEVKMYELWKNLPPKVASSTSFWTNATMEHVRSGRIEPTYLASNGISSQTGAERIDRVLMRKTGTNAEIQMDKCVRSVIRQLGGLPQRGNRSVLADCPFARAWWRERVLRSAEQRSGLPKAQIGELLRQSKNHWVEFVSVMVSRSPVFGTSLVQDAAAVGLMRLLPQSPDEKPPPSRLVQDVCHALCFVGGSRELGVLDFVEVRQMTEKIIDSILDTDP